jgi:hypothetical protein
MTGPEGAGGGTFTIAGGAGGATAGGATAVLAL